MVMPKFRSPESSSYNVGSTIIIIERTSDRSLVTNVIHVPLVMIGIDSSSSSSRPLLTVLYIMVTYIHLDADPVLGRKTRLNLENVYCTCIPTNCCKRSDWFSFMANSLVKGNAAKVVVQKS